MDIYLTHTSALEYWRHTDRCNPLRGLDPANHSSAEHISSADHVGDTPTGNRHRCDPEEFLYMNGIDYLTSPIHIHDNARGSNHRSNRFAYHSNHESLPVDSFIRVCDGLFVARPELCMVEMAPSCPFAQSVALGFELCGGYRIRPELARGFSSASRLTDPSSIDAYVSCLGTTHGRNTIQQAVPHIQSGSESPMETALAMLLTMPCRKGGYGLPAPSLNRPLTIGAHFRLHESRTTLRGDLLWPESSLIVEFDSMSFHSEPSDISRDAIRRNLLLDMGYRIITVTYPQVVNVIELDKVAKQIARQIGARIRIRSHNWRQKQAHLHAQLLFGNSIP